MPLHIFIKNLFDQKEKEQDKAAPLPEKIVRTVVVVTEEVDADSHFFSIENKKAIDGGLVFGLFLYISMLSFFFSNMTFDINLFHYWFIWLPAIAVLSFAIAASERTKSIVMGGMIFQAVSVSFMLINDSLDQLFVSKNFTLMMSSGGTMLWGLLCYEFDKIWRITNALLMPIMVGFFILLVIIFYNSWPAQI